jgi:asparagine synthase (glutamine-hydrolysing)
VADVPVGVFLSAGLDSSMIAALGSRHSDQPLTTLTLRFEEFQGTPWDEAPVAAEVAAELGTRHVERSVGRDQFRDLWPAAMAAMDQPSIDGFNTFVVSRVAHDEGIKVVLSGLGGDELMGSYESFVDVPRWSSWAGRMRHVPGICSWWPTLAGWVRPDKPKLAGLPQYGPSLAGAYFLRRALFLPPEIPALVGESLAREGLAAYDPLADTAKYLGGAEAGSARPTEGSVSAWEAAHLMESTQYMRNQLLRDCDWASMAHSLELRVPLADARLRDAMARCSYEPARGQGKAELVKQVAPELPESLWNRPKSGFFIPVMKWLEDDVGTEAVSGQVSRRLALKVLEAFGIQPVEQGRTALT